jgi:hypothetical protein
MIDREWKAVAIAMFAAEPGRSMRWLAANNVTRPLRKATKNRSKIKAARKQKAKRK